MRRCLCQRVSCAAAIFSRRLRVSFWSLASAVLIGGWFAAYLVTKETYAYSSVQDSSFFRYLMPAPVYSFSALELGRKVSGRT